MYFSWDTVKPDPARVRKRLIVCCDGTWQSSVVVRKNIPSNVTRLARSFAREDIDDDDETVWEQVVYYDAGIGTGEISKSEANRQGGFGSGFVSNCIEGYNWLALNWYPGDKIYCFGFSRGAYTARAIAGLVNDIGIISPRDMQDFSELYSEYIKFNGHDSHGFRKSRQYRRWQMGIKSSKGKDAETNLELFDKIPHSFVREESRLVEVVGVFDTVGSLGVPDSPYYTVDAAMAAMNKWWGGEDPGLHNVNLSPYIRNAFHALALDEHRAPFSPTLWHMPTQEEDDKDAQHQKLTPEEHEKAIEDARLEFEKIYFAKPDFGEDEDEKREAYALTLDKAWAKIMDCQTARLVHRLDKSNLQQVWFPGMHINIGGGSDDPLNDRKADMEQIALISFAWMCEQVKPFLKFEDRLRKRSVRDRLALMIPILSEIAQGKNQDFGSYAITKPFWKALNWTGAYKAPVKPIAPETICGWAVGPMPDSYTGSMVATGSLTRSPGEYCHDPKDKDKENPKELGPTNESIHPSVAYRMRALPDYKPPALAGFERKCNHGDWEWKKVDEDGKEVKVPEFEIPANAKFSRFLARDYVKYMAQAEQMGTLNKCKNKDKNKSTEPGTPPSTPPMKPDAPATEATAFLDATDRGVEWVKPARKQ